MKRLKELRLSDDRLWYVVKAFYGMRVEQGVSRCVVRDMYVAYEWTLLQTVPCLAYSSRLDALSGWHHDDFCTEKRARNTGRCRRGDLGDLQGQSASIVGTRCERGGYDLETHPQVVNGMRSPDARCDAYGESVKLPRGQGRKVKPKTLCTCHWTWSAGRVGTIGSDSVPARHRNRSAPRSRLV